MRLIAEQIDQTERKEERNEAQGTGASRPVRSSYGAATTKDFASELFSCTVAYT
jgi:hypothetical protein